ncbi:hypothetical protein AB0H57_31730 [Micromonospora sp. NPDC050686]|uniref:hypothetical protein n=1 Tax=Micromonospora sp. NPDC050686 TaxID=3154631 RepID=UPI0034081388
MSDPPADRDAYVDAFVRAARQAVAGDLADWTATLETLEVEYEPAAGADSAYATATLRFRGRRYRYRRRIWPADHPALSKAGLYATLLTERLLTRSPSGEPDGDGSIIRI